MTIVADDDGGCDGDGYNDDESTFNFLEMVWTC